MESKMKKSALIVLALALFSPISGLRAEDAAVVAAPATVDTSAQEAMPAEIAPFQTAEVAPDAVIPAALEAVSSANEEAAPVAAQTENLEFVSGEIAALDEAAKKVTVKLYGETEGSKEKSVTIEIDDTTDITDGEKDRDIKSLVVGTEVDVEFDPTSSKATYIFVY